jgi:hypothetical protein
MRVITGKPDHPTPSFHDRMEYLIVNPYWKIPESIVKQEMLGHLIRDPYYYERRGKHLHKTWDEDSPRVDPGSINWAQYRSKKKHIPYYFMQLPGTSNALGKIKFLFPNHYSVYIHDTPTKKLFFRNVRAFSHGCMRIQKPREMLKALSLYNDNIDVDELMALLKTKEKKTVVLKHKIPVDIVYLTAFVDDYGNLNFRGDIYGYDKYQLENYKYKMKRSRENKNYFDSEDKKSDHKKTSLQSKEKSIKMKRRDENSNSVSKKKKLDSSEVILEPKECNTSQLPKTGKKPKEDSVSISAKTKEEPKDGNNKALPAKMEGEPKKSSSSKNEKPTGTEARQDTMDSKKKDGNHSMPKKAEQKLSQIVKIEKKSPTQGESEKVEKKRVNALFKVLEI